MFDLTMETYLSHQHLQACKFHINLLNSIIHRFLDRTRFERAKSVNHLLAQAGYLHIIEKPDNSHLMRLLPVLFTDPFVLMLSRQ